MAAVSSAVPLPAISHLVLIEVCSRGKKYPECVVPSRERGEEQSPSIGQPAANLLLAAPATRRLHHPYCT